MGPARGGEVEEVKLSQAASYMLDECRMVLPGVQAIFGFQLIAVFNERFANDLPEFAQYTHFASLTLVALAAGLVMSPAAYHRITGIQHVSRHFLTLSSRFLLASMLALALGLALDYFVVGWLIFESAWVAAPAAILLGVFSVLWFAYPKAGHRAGK
jgi:uncharacterized PurR-regulated membrane protein YhhQ (DUF165 family)